jgi:hypothetical protein
MIFWPFCAFTWFTNIEKMPLQMTSGFLQLESTLCIGSAISIETPPVGFFLKFSNV